MPVRIAGRDGQEPPAGRRREHSRPPTADRRAASKSSDAEVAEPVTRSCSQSNGAPAPCGRCATSRARSPDDVMAALDITHRQYSRPFGRTTTAINRKLVAYLVGDWCPGYASRFAHLAAGRTPPHSRSRRRSTRRVSQLPDRGRDIHTATPRAPERPSPRGAAHPAGPVRPLPSRAGAGWGVRVGRPPFVRGKRLDEDAGALAYGRMWAREWSSRPRVSSTSGAPVMHGRLDMHGSAVDARR